MPHCRAAFFMFENMNHTPELFRERLFHQNERVMKFGLDAMHRALETLGQPTYPVILVAGTNGKGQVSALLSTIAHRQGYRTGLFTSPHLIDFSERIRVNGQRPDSQTFYDVGWHILNTFGGTEDPEENARRRESTSDQPPVLTYFECCFAMAVELFRRESVEMGIYEVGLGGRLDATNVLSPALSIITSIGLDHEAYLGHTPDAIAREKAGIMRAGHPVVIGRQCHAVLTEEAHSRHCSALYALGTDFDWHETPDGEIELTYGQNTCPMPGARHLAAFQRDNAAIAFFGAHLAYQTGIFSRDPLSPHCDAIEHTRWVGRMYSLPSAIAESYRVAAIIMDGAHNPDGVRRFCEAIRTRPASRRVLIVNSCKDKSIDAMFVQYLDLFDRSDIFVPPVANPRILSPRAYCEQNALPATQACSTLSEAFERAAQCAGPDGTLYVTGSLYLLGEALNFLGDTTILESTEY